ncbi:MAG: hybrid sensor histidine kinase/response regulator [Candidatus Eisenbacteria bacterium]|nr:hybrid sensor histidine kinase/response regulator [Candidatus Eisenbacteria bacterium]
MILVAHGGAESAIFRLATERIPNLVPLERPVHLATLCAAVRSALAARERQYQIRDHMLERERSVALLEETRDRLAAAKEAAEDATRAKDEFLAMLSHELRAPLTPVLMAIDLLERDSRFPSGLRDMLALLRRNVELEARLIDDMLDLTRIVRGKIMLEPRVVDAHEVIRHAFEKIHPEIQAKQLLIEFDLMARHTLLEADPGRLEQVLWNLLKNAVKFTPDRGKVHVRSGNRVEDGAESIEIEIRDTGIGFEASFLPRIFQPFQQAEGRPASAGGLGLGLSICKALVELHGGEIRAWSEGRGKGASFTITMRTIEVPAAVGLEGREGEARRKSPRPMTILLVEDHEDSAEMLSRLLEALGHRVTVAGTVQQAFDEAAEAAAADAPFDLLISDLGLPDGSGIDLIEKVRQKCPIPAIVLSGYGMDADIERSRKAGFLAHLVKPVSIENLVAVMDDLSGLASRGA